MTQGQPREPDDGSYHMVLDESLVRDLPDEQFDQLVSRLVSLASEVKGTQQAEAERMVAQGMSSVGLELPEVYLSRLSEQLLAIQDGELAISTTGGRALHRPDLVDAAHHAPKVSGTADPEHPDRPAYS